jgi:hypothetical protein
MHPETATTLCRCGGTGAYTAEIVLADAVVSDRRLCIEHGLGLRALVYDSTRGCNGVVMEVVRDSTGISVWLRSAGGGTEWKTHVGSLRPAREPS